MYVVLLQKKTPYKSSRWGENKLSLDKLEIQRILVLSIQRSIGGSWKIWENIPKIHGESLERGHDPIEKIISTITAINKRWPPEVVRTMKQTAQFMF